MQAMAAQRELAPEEELARLLQQQHGNPELQEAAELGITLFSLSLLSESPRWLDLVLHLLSQLQPKPPENLRRRK